MSPPLGQKYSILSEYIFKTKKLHGDGRLKKKESELHFLKRKIKDKIYFIFSKKKNTC